MPISREYILENLGAWLRAIGTSLEASVTTQRDILGNDVKQFINLSDSLLDHVGQLSLGGLTDRAKEWVVDATAAQGLREVNRLFVTDGGEPRFLSYVRDAEDFINRSTGSFAGEAFAQIAGILQGGQDIYLALLSQQVDLAKDQVEENRTLLNNLIDGTNSMISFLENIYGDAFYRMLDANRKVAALLLRQSEQNMNTVTRRIDEQGVFDHGRYDYGMENIVAAQAALAAGARADRLPRRGSARRRPTEGHVLGSLAGIVDLAGGDDLFNRAVEEVAAELQLSQADYERLAEGQLTIEEILSSDTGNVFLDTAGAMADEYVRALALYERMISDSQKLLHGHRHMLLRLRALRNIEEEIGTARIEMANIRDEVAVLASNIVRLYSDMEAAEGRLALMTQTPQWIARLGFMRNRMEIVISDGTRQALRETSEVNIINQEYADLIADLDKVGLDSADEVRSLTQEGTDIFGQYLQMLTGREEVPTDLISRIRDYRARLIALRNRYGAIDRELGGVTAHSHAAVTALNEFIDENAPMLDGLRYLIDAGRWTLLGQFNAELATSFGLIGFTVRRAIAGAVLPPDLQDLIDRLLELLSRNKRQADQEVAFRQDVHESLKVAIDADRQRADNDLLVIGRVGAAVVRFQEIVDGGFGTLTESGDTIEARSIALSLDS